jgi:hypothetical protein
MTLHATLNEGRHLIPCVEGDAPSSYDIVDEVTVPSSQLEDTILRTNPALEIEPDERPP